MWTRGSRVSDSLPVSVSAVRGQLNCCSSPDHEFLNLPFSYKWASVAEGSQQLRRRPDAVAWNPHSKVLLLLEFTRAMDKPDTMEAALQAKGQQYDAAVCAIRASKGEMGADSTVDSVVTVPLIFRVRGSVLLTDAMTGLLPFSLTPAQFEKVMTRGVRAAITGLSDMCTARFAALRCLPRPLPPSGRRRNSPVVIPPKPYVKAPWRSDRGGGR